MPQMSSLAVLLHAADAQVPSQARAHHLEPSAGDLLRHEPELRRLVHRLLGWTRRAADVDDIVQDVLLAAWRNLDGFRGEARPATWLWRIAIHTTRSHQRRVGLWRRFFPPTATPAEPTAEPPVPEAGATALDAKMQRVQAAMAKLAHADRELLVLRYLEQRDIAQIAAALDLPRNTVDARLSRARARLRDLLPEVLHD